MHGGWTPAVHLYSQARGKLRFDGDATAFVPNQSFQPERSAGACNGAFALAACFADGALDRVDGQVGLHHHRFIVLDFNHERGAGDRDPLAGKWCAA